MGCLYLVLAYRKVWCFRVAARAVELAVQLWVADRAHEGPYVPRAVVVWVRCPSEVPRLVWPQKGL